MAMARAMHNVHVYGHLLGNQQAMILVVRSFKFASEHVEIYSYV
jgi:hypothetical protein